jgi:hypothetical protein
LAGVIAIADPINPTTPDALAIRYRFDLSIRSALHGYDRAQNINARKLVLSHTTICGCDRNSTYRD